MGAHFLMCGDGAQSAMYATKYATKTQTSFDNLHVIEIAFNKRVQKELCSEEELTDHTRGVGRLLVLARAATDIMEIGGPLACHYLMNGSGSYFSANFQVLVLTETLKVLSQKDIQGILVRNKESLLVRSVCNDYKHRPTAVEDVQWYDFVAWYRKVSSAKKRGREQSDTAHDSGKATDISDEQASDAEEADSHDAVENAPLSFMQTHPEAAFFKLKKVQWPMVPRIIGPRMPDVRKIGQDPEAYELYCRIALCLYHPFRDATEFLDENGSAIPKFEEWDPFSKADLSRKLAYHQEYWVGLAAAEAYREKQKETDQACATESGDIDTDTFDRQQRHRRQTETER